MANQRDEIMRAAMRGVRLYGMEGVRIRHIAELAGASAGSIYQHFNGKEHLLQVCFEEVDRQIAKLFDHVTLERSEFLSNPERTIHRLWSMYFRWLVDHPDETVFYHRFRDSSTFPAYEKQRDVSYFASFIDIIHLFEQHFHIFKQVDFNVFWLFLLTSTVMYAKNVVEGVLPNTQETENAFYRLEMFGLQAVFAQSAERSEMR